MRLLTAGLLVRVQPGELQRESRTFIRDSLFLFGAISGNFIIHRFFADVLNRDVKCTRGRTRTGKVLPPVVFETTASTNSATRAGGLVLYRMLYPTCSNRTIQNVLNIAFGSIDSQQVPACFFGNLLGFQSAPAPKFIVLSGPASISRFNNSGIAVPHSKQI